MIASGPLGAVTVRVNVFVAVSCVGVVETETPTANVKLPAAVGVPDNTPALNNAMPVGGEPLTTDRAAWVYVTTPAHDRPVAAGIWSL